MYLFIYVVGRFFSILKSKGRLFFSAPNLAFQIAARRLKILQIGFLEIVEEEKLLCLTKPDFG